MAEIRRSILRSDFLAPVIDRDALVLKLGCIDILVNATERENDRGIFVYEGQNRAQLHLSLSPPFVSRHIPEDQLAADNYAKKPRYYHHEPIQLQIGEEKRKQRNAHGISFMLAASDSGTQCVKE
jgi:hypothetical protein